MRAKRTKIPKLAANGAFDYYAQVSGPVLAEREPARAFLASKIGQFVVQLDEGANAQCAGLSFEVTSTERDQMKDEELGYFDRGLGIMTCRSGRRSGAVECAQHVGTAAYRGL
jgi:hypothetical protein